MRTPGSLLFAAIATPAAALLLFTLTTAQAGGGGQPPAPAPAPKPAPVAPSPFRASPLAEHPGWALASACFACHGTDGKDETFGALNVFTKEDFIARMQELKATEAESEGLMAPHSAGYTDAQIELMADYFSQVE